MSKNSVSRKKKGVAAFKKLQKIVRFTIMAMFLHIGNKKRELKRREEFLKDFGLLFKEVRMNNLSVYIYKLKLIFIVININICYY